MEERRSCDNCAYCDEERTEQPCCGCVEQSSWEDADLIGEREELLGRADTILGALEGIELWLETTDKTDTARWLKKAVSLIELLRAEWEKMEQAIDAEQKKVRAMKNDLCWICGKYRKSYLGACDGCRWRE